MSPICHPKFIVGDGSTCCCSGCNKRKEVIHDYLKIGDFTLFQDDAEMYFKAKSEKREFHNWRDIRVNVYV